MHLPTGSENINSDDIVEEKRCGWRMAISADPVHRAIIRLQTQIASIEFMVLNSAERD